MQGEGGGGGGGGWLGIEEELAAGVCQSIVTTSGH